MGVQAAHLIEHNTAEAHASSVLEERLPKILALTPTGLFDTWQLPN
jgi:hypothetical protein